MKTDWNALRMRGYRIRWDPNGDGPPFPWIWKYIRCSYGHDMRTPAINPYSGAVNMATADEECEHFGECGGHIIEWKKAMALDLARGTN